MKKGIMGKPKIWRVYEKKASVSSGICSLFGYREQFIRDREYDGTIFC
jgi:hypothetical protein